MSREDGFYWVKFLGGLEEIEVARWESEQGWMTCGWEVPIDSEKVEVLSDKLYAKSSMEKFRDLDLDGMKLIHSEGIPDKIGTTEYYLSGRGSGYAIFMRLAMLDGEDPTVLWYHAVLSPLHASIARELELGRDAESS